MDLVHCLSACVAVPVCVREDESSQELISIIDKDPLIVSESNWTLEAEVKEKRKKK